MNSIPPLNDPERIHALQKTQLMDSPSEAAFERLTFMATRLLRTPVALVSLVDEHRQFFKSAKGLPAPWLSARGTPLSHSFCKHVVNDGTSLIINDAANNPRVKDNLAVSELGVAAYAGIPIKTSEGHTLGSFCVIDVKPRVWSDEELQLLNELAESCMAEVSLRQLLTEKEGQLQQFEDWIARLPLGAFKCDSKMAIKEWNPAAEKILGYPKSQALGRNPAELLFKPEDVDTALQRFADMATNGEPLRNVFSCLSKDGEAVTCSWTTTILHQPNGQMDGFIAMFEVAGDLVQNFTGILRTIRQNAALIEQKSASENDTARLSEAIGRDSDKSIALARRLEQ